MPMKDAMGGGERDAHPPRISPAGDAALVVTLGRAVPGGAMDRIMPEACLRHDPEACLRHDPEACLRHDPEACLRHDVSQRVLALGERIMMAAKQGLVEPGFLEVVPGMTSLTVHFDPDVLDADSLTAWLAATASEHDQTGAGPRPRRWRVPVCYDPAFALDLDEVASRTGLTTDAVIARHSGTDYHVYMLGFLPGFPYMGDLDAALRLPRRDTPRVAVPAGAVAIAGAMTAIYPAESPGGWHVIGRTPVRLFDVAATEPAVLAPGDSVRFCAVGRTEFERLEGDVRAGRWTLVPEDPAQHGAAG